MQKPPRARHPQYNPTDNKHSAGAGHMPEMLVGRFVAKALFLNGIARQSGNKPAVQAGLYWMKLQIGRQSWTGLDP